MPVLAHLYLYHSHFPAPTDSLDRGLERVGQRVRTQLFSVGAQALPGEKKVVPTLSLAPLAVIPLQVARRTEPGQAGALGQRGRRMPLPWEGVGGRGTGSIGRQ